MSKQPPTRTYCKCSRPLPYCNPNCRTPQHWKFTQHHRTTRPPRCSLWETSYGSQEIDVCTCREVDGQMQCMRSGGVTLMMTTCPTAAVLRVSGDGFVTNINFTDNTFVEVILERSTITYFEGWSHFLKADLLNDQRHGLCENCHPNNNNKGTSIIILLLYLVAHLDHTARLHGSYCAK